MWGRWPLRRWFRVLWVLLSLCVVAALPLLVIDFKRHGYPLHDQVRLRLARSTMRSLACWSCGCC